MADQKKAPTPEMMKIVDPLGEIRRLSETLWNDAGKPAGTSWEDYWTSAEKLLNAGYGADPKERRSRMPTLHEQHLSSLVRELRSQSSDELLSILAAAFDGLLDEHEASSLGRILEDHSFTLKEESKDRLIESVPRERAAELLAHLVWEYDIDFISREGGGRFENIPFEKRKAYWEDRLKKRAEQDEPLTFADQTTMRRLVARIEAEPRIRKLTYLR